MSTRPCPHCHEIIPTDLDYCPYCNQSTRESLQTSEDAALAERHERAATGGAATLPPDSVSEQGGSGIPPTPSVDRCMMCMTAPATVGEYCLDCRNKLDMGPEQWDMIKQDAKRRSTIAWTIAAVILIMTIVLVAKNIHHPAGPAAPRPATSTSTP